jgi:acetate---CoA ligase (ADP-forming)
MPSSNDLPRDVSGRLLALRDVDLDGFLHPRSVAVVGASDASRKPNTLMTARIKAFADANGAAFYPVTPSYPEVQGVATFASIADVPGDIDLAVLLTGAERVVDNFEEAVHKKAKFAVIFSAGFSEIGPAGEALEARLAGLARGGDTRLLGPNTNLNAFSDFRTDLTGPAIALVTQSGHQGRPIFQGQELGIRLSHWAPTGNEVDLEFADWARYFADQPEVGVVAAYIEGFKDGRSLMLAADHAAKLRKPLVIVKVGKTDAGASMAQSHTGHLTGSDAVTSAVFRQLGVTRVDGLDELLDVSAAFARTRPPRRPRVEDAGICVYAISGGTGAHMADMVSAAGLRLRDLTKKTQKILHDGLIPSYLRVSNPVDCGGPPVMTAAGRKILDAIVADPNVDVLIVPITGALESMSGPMARDLVAVSETTDKPIFVVWGSPVGTEPAYVETLLESRLPVFRTFANCVRAVRAYLDYWTFVARYESPFDDAPTKPLAAAKKARSVLAAAPAGTALSEWSSKQVLRAYGIKTTDDVLCQSEAEAVKAAKATGFPVVMKVASPDLPHKSDAGLVKIGVASPKEVRAAYADLLAGAKRADRKARIEGVMVNEMVGDGVETLIGISHDPLFGPVVTVGLGGIFVEVLHDVTFRVPPFHRDEAQRMIDELQGAAMLRGVRGAKPVDEPALVDTIMKVQRLALDLADDISELDVNPLVVRSRGVVALDALVVRK